MPGTPLPVPPVRVGVSITALHRNVALRDALRATAVDVQNCAADVWILAITQVLDAHGYRLELFLD